MFRLHFFDRCRLIAFEISSNENVCPLVKHIQTRTKLVFYLAIDHDRAQVKTLITISTMGHEFTEIKRQHI
jgi:hypothetical protein